MVVDVKKLRKDKKLTQIVFSEITGIGQSYLSEIENGRRDVSNEVLDKLIESFGIETIEKYAIQNKEVSVTPVVSFNTGVPYYDVDFIGGFDLVLNDQTTTPAYMIDFQMYNSSDCWCNVTGHSMEPAISNGDIIALKEVQDWTTFLPFGEIYAIVTTEHRTIKKISAGHDHNFFTLIPLNKSIEYQPQEIPKSIILKVYKVMGCMKKL